MSDENKKDGVVVAETEAPENLKSKKQVTKENKDLEESLKPKKASLADILKEKEEMKLKKEDDKMSVMLVEEQDRSVNIGVIGVGQCGSKIAEEFYKRDYPTVAINTAMQDLKYINVPENQKLFLDFALGGAGKDLEVGRAAAEEYAEEIRAHIEEHMGDCDILMLATSGGGGSGSGSAETMIDIMSDLGKPISVIFVLPLTSEDAVSKHNAIQTLAKLAKLASTDVINSLMVVDNAKIEMMYPDLSMAQFWKTANQAIVEPLHLFNQLSAAPSPYTSLDPMDFSRVFVGTGDCSLYGMVEIEDYTDEEAIAHAMVTTLESGLLAGGFDLKQTRAAGVIITGPKRALEKIPAANLEYGFAMVNKVCSEGTRVFRGVYSTPTKDDKIRVYSFFSGLGLPDERVAELKEEAERHMETLKDKEENRASAMNIDIGKTKTTSAADRVYNKIKSKNSAMGKLTRNSKRVVDKRRR